MDVRHVVVDTLLGKVTLVASGESVVGLYFPHHWYRPAQDSLGAEVPVAEDALLNLAAGQLGEYLAGERASFELPSPRTAIRSRSECGGSCGTFLAAKR